MPNYAPAGNWLSSEFVPDLVSIIVPTHNRALLLRKAIASIIAQSYRPIECLIIDDGSTDQTEAEVEKLRLVAGPRLVLRYFRQSQAGGCVARNRGLKASQGEFIAYLDSDDEFLPEAIRLRVERLKSSNAPYCYDRGQRVDEHGTELGFFGSEWPSDGGPVIWRYLFQTAGPLIRRSVCRGVGPWNESLRGFQEVEYFARLIIAAGRGEYINQIGHRIFEHDGPRIVGSLPHSESRLQAWELILLHLEKSGEDYAKDREIYSKFVRELFSVAANTSYQRKDYRAARENLSKACRYGYQRWHVKLYLHLFRVLPAPLLSHVYFLPKLAFRDIAKISARSVAALGRTRGVGRRSGLDAPRA